MMQNWQLIVSVSDESYNILVCPEPSNDTVRYFIIGGSKE
jgi:hypothetical protein